MLVIGINIPCTAHGVYTPDIPRTAHGVYTPDIPCTGHGVYTPDIPCTGSWSLVNRETLSELRSELRSDALFVTTIDFSGI